MFWKQKSNENFLIKNLAKVKECRIKPLKVKENNFWLEFKVKESPIKNLEVIQMPIKKWTNFYLEIPEFLSICLIKICFMLTKFSKACTEIFHIRNGTDQATEKVQNSWKIINDSQGLETNSWLKLEKSW